MFDKSSHQRARRERSRWKRGLALATLVTAAAVPAFAGSAHAGIGTGTPTPAGQVVLETIGFGFLGTPDGISDVSFTGAEAKFTWSRGIVGAHVAGNMHVDGGQNARFRLRVDSLTANNDVIDSAVDKEKGTAIKTASHDIPVDMDAVSAPNLAKVRVVLEEKGANPNWKSRGEYYVQAVPRTDDVTILGKTIDVGGSTWDNGKPTNAASVSWSVGADGALTATYRGFMHFKNFAGSGRVVLRAFDPSTGLVHAHTEGETHSSGGNGHEVSPDGNVPETLTVSSSSASSVKVVMQSWVPGPGEGGGAWQDVDSQAVSAGE